MIPRVRPPISDNFFQGLNNSETNHSRKDLHDQISLKLKNYYPEAHNFEFFNYGRNSLSICLDLLDIQKDENILIPCFTCSTVLEPFLQKKISSKFYDINFDYSCNVMDIEKKIDGKTKAILITHFFGIPSNILEIKKIADEKNILIIEDCAHIFCSSTDGISPGSVGDLAFTSFGNDKPISFGNGSVLIINNPIFASKLLELAENIELNDIVKEKIAFLAFLYFYINTNKTRYSHFIGVYYYFNKLMRNQELSLDELNSIIKEYQINNNFEKTMQKLDNDIDFAKSKSYFHPEFLSFSLIELMKQLNCLIVSVGIQTHIISTNQPRLLNYFSLNIFNKIFPDIELINQLRIDNGKKFYALLKENKEIFLPTNGENIPILRFSIVCKDCKNASILTKELRRQGYEVGNYNWSPALNKIINRSEKCKNAEIISKTIINIPCHGDITDRDIEQICLTINRITQK